MCRRSVKKAAKKRIDFLPDLLTHEVFLDCGRGLAAGPVGGNQVLQLPPLMCRFLESIANPQVYAA